MRSTRRTSNRKGFTLIELLIVVVIIGILAAVAIPKFSNTKEKAYVASMKSDLKNLVSVEESYYADKNTYGALADIGGTTTYGFVPSKSNVVAITGNSATGWAATVTNPGVTSTGSTTCGIKLGSATAPNAAVTQDGVPVCY